MLPAALTPFLGTPGERWGSEKPLPAKFPGGVFQDQVKACHRPEKAPSPASLGYRDVCDGVTLFCEGITFDRKVVER